MPPRPATQPFYPGLDDWGYGRSIEWRFTRGGFDSLGAADVWAQVRLPLVDGVALTGQDRALILADSANGLSLSLPLEQWFSIPPTMTATLLRPPAGEWVHLACRTYLADNGVGLADADLFDPDGLIGEVAQPLLVQKRKPRATAPPDSMNAQAYPGPWSDGPVNARACARWSSSDGGQGTGRMNRPARL